MPLTELNMMIHSHYFYEGHEVRKPSEKRALEGKLNRIMALFGRRK
jgi:hypothetical protein